MQVNTFVNEKLVIKASFLYNIYEVAKMINRPMYLNTLIQTIDKDFVKLLVGVRRSGKSTLLKLLQQYLLKNKINPKRIIEINFEMIEFDELKDKQTLHNYINNNILGEKKHYLFIDEVQEIPEWARIINSLKASFNLDIYVTGSNARVFTGEHLTYLAGRYISISVFPLMYQEFIQFRGLGEEFSNHYNAFLDSSFPAIVLEPNQNLKNIMKQDMFEAIFQRDMILRGHIRNESLFLKVARFILEHIGSMISTNKITATLNSQGTKISYEAVDNYISLMVKSYFLYPCQRYDIRGKEILKTNGKYYVIDFGIRQKLIPNIESNTGRILENFIYLELIKKGYDVYVGKVGRDYEIDFVAIRNNKKTYIQVSESIIDPKTREREIKPFNYIRGISNSYLVTFDEIKYESEQFNHINVFDFINVI